MDSMERADQPRDGAHSLRRTTLSQPLRRLRTAAAEAAREKRVRGGLLDNLLYEHYRRTCPIRQA